MRVIRRTRAVGPIILVSARRRHIVGTQWGGERCRDISHTKAPHRQRPTTSSPESSHDSKGISPGCTSGVPPLRPPALYRCISDPTPGNLSVAQPKPKLKSFLRRCRSLNVRNMSTTILFRSKTRLAHNKEGGQLAKPPANSIRLTKDHYQLTVVDAPA
jgi:hypothetical protein